MMDPASLVTAYALGAVTVLALLPWILRDLAPRTPPRRRGRRTDGATGREGDPCADCGRPLDLTPCWLCSGEGVICADSGEPPEGCYLCRATGYFLRCENHGEE